MSSKTAIPTAVATAHTAVRLDFPMAEDFESFRERFESAVPAFTPEIFGEGDGWDAVTERTMAAAPFGFLRYNRLDVLPFFSRAGHTVPCTSYLMGNHVFAERMFGHHPAVMIYAPLRVAIYADEAGAAHFCVDQPSSRFGSFDAPEIVAVGQMLDQRLERLLEHLVATG